MIVLSGASASGKTEVAKVLASKYGITKVITTTTREKRVGEVDGKDYFFVTKSKFEEMLNQELFVETTLYNDNFYGSTKDQVKNDKCVVIDPSGLRSYINLKSDNVVTIFLDCKKDIRFKRMLQRGDPIEKAKERILLDRVAFNKRSLPSVDLHINSEAYSIEAIADMIYCFYKAELERRKSAD